MKTVIFTNQKGGVGKTTLTRELGIALAEREYSVLLIDSDPQGNLTKSLFDYEGPGLYEAFENEKVEFLFGRKNLTLLSGDSRLAALEKRYLGDVDAYLKLKTLYESKTFNDFDVILIDSPPSLSVMTLNGLAVADYFIIPLRPALYSLQGTNDLLASVAKVKKSLNSGLELLGVILNEYNSLPVISRQIRDEIVEGFGDKVFSTVVSRTVKIEEAIASRSGVIDEKTKVAEEIQNLTTELLRRLDL